MVAVTHDHRPNDLQTTQIHHLTLLQLTARHGSQGAKIKALVGLSAFLGTSGDNLSLLFPAPGAPTLLDPWFLPPSSPPAFRTSFWLSFRTPQCPRPLALFPAPPSTWKDPCDCAGGTENHLFQGQGVGALTHLHASSPLPCNPTCSWELGVRVQCLCRKWAWHVSTHHTLNTRVTAPGSVRPGQFSNARAVALIYRTYLFYIYKMC